MAEALHEAKEDGSITPPLVTSYVATQAAISTSFYSGSEAYNFFTAKGLTRVNRPDLAAHFVASITCDDPAAMPYMAGTHDYAGKWFNLYNNKDYGVGDDAAFLWYEGWSNANGFGAWEWNDVYWRPWVGLLAGSSVGSRQYGYDSNLRQFFELTCTAPYVWTPLPLDPVNPDHRFKIFSYAFQPKGWPVGSHIMSDADWLWNGGQVDLDGDKYHFGNNHYAHDGQFMYSIAERWQYWFMLLDKLGIQRWPKSP
jgi:hypothetical protein